MQILIFRIISHSVYVGTEYGEKIALKMSTTAQLLSYLMELHLRQPVGLDKRVYPSTDVW